MIEIRPAKIKDAPQIADLCMEMLRCHEPYSELQGVRKDARKRCEDYFRKVPRISKKKIYVAEDEGKLIGYCLGEIRRRPPIYTLREMAFVSDLAVTLRYQRKGLGEELMEKMFEWFKEKGLTYVDLHVAAQNEPAIAFYKKHMFQDTWRQMYRKI